MIYFAGLKGLTYVDKTQGGKLVKEENEVVQVNGFVDRVYQNAPDVVEVMVDTNKRITLTKVLYYDIPNLCLFALKQYVYCYRKKAN